MMQRPLSRSPWKCTVWAWVEGHSGLGVLLSAPVQPPGAAQCLLPPPHPSPIPSSGKSATGLKCLVPSNGKRGAEMQSPAQEQKLLSPDTLISGPPCDSAAFLPALGLRLEACFFQRQHKDGGHLVCSRQLLESGLGTSQSSRHWSKAAQD